MPLPLAPIAGIALKYTAVAAAGYLLARSLPAADPDPRIDAAMDDMADGLAIASHDGASRGAWRLRRTFQLGTTGAKIDASVLARLKVSRV